MGVIRGARAGKRAIPIFWPNVPFCQISSYLAEMVSVNDAHSDQHAKIISAEQSVVLSFGTFWDTWDANPNFKPDGWWLLK